jgi:mono/diheme cytochrome c family protein
LLVAGLLASSPGHADARFDYMMSCQGCHRDDGRGNPGNVPDLRGELGLLLAEAGGRRYLVQVPGSRNAAMNDAALAAVLNWMVPTFSAATLPADFKPYSADEVRRYRSEPVGDIAAERAKLMQDIDRRDR